mgnify:FL=1
MKNPNIAKVLKEYRKQNHYSVEDVVFKLEEQNLPFATKTIYGWESGQTQPDADTLMYLCKLYEIKDVLGTFGYKTAKDKMILTEHEEALILAYRSKEIYRKAIDKLLDL